MEPSYAILTLAEWLQSRPVGDGDRTWWSTANELARLDVKDPSPGRDLIGSLRCMATEAGDTAALAVLKAADEHLVKLELRSKLLNAVQQLHETARFDLGTLALAVGDLEALAGLVAITLHGRRTDGAVVRQKTPRAIAEEGGALGDLHLVARGLAALELLATEDGGAGLPLGLQMVEARHMACTQVGILEDIVTPGARKSLVLRSLEAAAPSSAEKPRQAEARAS